MYAAAQFYGVDIPIYAKEYATIGGILFSRWMNQMPVAMQIVPCGFYLIMATAIITASGHPETLLGPLGTLRT